MFTTQEASLGFNNTHEVCLQSYCVTMTQSTAQMYTYYLQYYVLSIGRPHVSHIHNQMYLYTI